MDRFGLSETVINQICTVFDGFPDIERAILYGSRAKGNYRPGSDIDLTLIGHSLTEPQLLQIETRLDDLLLPYTFDLNNFDSLETRELIEHIRRVGQVLYKKNEHPVS